MIKVKECTCDICRAKCARSKLNDSYEQWWATEGSHYNVYLGESLEEFRHRLCRIAWINGGYVNE